MHPDQVIERTKEGVRQKMLYRCLTCEALVEYMLDLSLFETGGILHNLAIKTHKRLDPTKMYSFPTYGNFHLPWTGCGNICFESMFLYITPIIHFKVWVKANFYWFYKNLYFCLLCNFHNFTELIQFSLVMD